MFSPSNLFLNLVGQAFLPAAGLPRGVVRSMTNHRRLESRGRQDACATSKT
jgi:hypothetical protein